MDATFGKQPGSTIGRPASIAEARERSSSS